MNLHLGLSCYQVMVEWMEQDWREQGQEERREILLDFHSRVVQLIWELKVMLSV